MQRTGERTHGEKSRTATAIATINLHKDYDFRMPYIEVEVGGRAHLLANKKHRSHPQHPTPTPRNSQPYLPLHIHPVHHPGNESSTLFTSFPNSTLPVFPHLSPPSLFPTSSSVPLEVPNHSHCGISGGAPIDDPFQIFAPLSLALQSPHISTSFVVVSVVCPSLHPPNASGLAVCSDLSTS